jgi:hypothetical protein
MLPNTALRLPSRLIAPCCIGRFGNRIRTEVLQGQRAEYGKQIIPALSQRLTQSYGKGWGQRQLRYCTLLAEVFPEREILHTVCAKLSWSHLKLLIGIEDPLKRDFYIEIAAR